VVGLVDVRSLVWRRLSNPNARGVDASGPWRLCVPGPPSNAALQHPQLPGRLCRERLVIVVGLLGHVRRWLATSNAFRHGAACVRWQRVPELGQHSKLQHATLPRQLRRHLVVGVVGVLQDVRLWRAGVHPLGRGVCCLWRHCLPVLDAVANLQHAAVCHQLRRQWLVRVVRLLGSVRWRRAAADPHHHQGVGVRRCRMPQLVATAGVQHAGVPTLAHGCVVVLLQDVRQWRSNAFRDLLQWQRGTVRGQRVQGWLQARRIPGVQHPGVPHQLSGGRLDRLVGLSRGLRHWPSDPHSPSHHATGFWRRRLPSRVRVADLQLSTLPHPMCRQRLVRVVGLLQDVWQWCANADPHRDGGACAWWHRVPGFVAVPEMQHAALPRQLRGQWLVRVVGLLQDLWPWSANVHAHCGVGGGLWRCTVPGPDARTGLQHPAVRHQLRRQCLVRLVVLRQEVRHGYPTPDAHRPGGSGPRRRGVPRVDANAELQHPEVPCQLRRRCVVGLVGLLSLVWRWSPNVAAHRDGGSGLRRGGLPSLGATTGLQHAKLPH